MSPDRAAELLCELRSALGREIRRADAISLSLVRVQMLTLTDRLHREIGRRAQAIEDEIDELERLEMAVEAELSAEEEDDAAAEPRPAGS